MAVNAYGGVAKHGELAGLGNDEHLQYASWSQGTFANRPAAGRAGRTYYATDTGFTYWDTGTSWLEATSSTVNVEGDQTVNGLKTFTSQVWINKVNASGGGATNAALRLGSAAYLSQWQAADATSGNTNWGDNLYHDGTNWVFGTTTTRRGGLLQIANGGLHFFNTAPQSTAAGTAAALTQMFQVSSTGHGGIYGTTASLTIGAAATSTGSAPTNDSERLVVWSAANQTQAVIQSRSSAGGELFGSYATYASFRTMAAMNDQQLRLRGSADGNHYVGFSAAQDGPDISGYAGGRLGHMTTGAFTEILRWTTDRITLYKPLYTSDTQIRMDSWLNSSELTHHITNLNVLQNRPSGFYEAPPNSTGTPTNTWYSVINVRHTNAGNNHGMQLAVSFYDSNLWVRHYNGGNGTDASPGTVYPWVKVNGMQLLASATNITNNNIGSFIAPSSGRVVAWVNAPQISGYTQYAWINGVSYIVHQGGAASDNWSMPVSGLTPGASYSFGATNGHGGAYTSIWIEG